MSASGHGRYRCSQGRQRGANHEPWKPGPARDVVFGKLEAEKNRRIKTVEIQVRSAARRVLPCEARPPRLTWKNGCYLSRGMGLIHPLIIAKG
jgi:hypothetical protein